MSNIVILGAGPCGLSAAWELSQKGHKVTVIEKESRVGGLCRTVEHKGFRFDLGGHRFISRDEKLVHEISKLMGDELLVSERKSAIRFQGKMYRYPLSIKDVFGKMSTAIAIRAFVDYLKISVLSPKKPLASISFEDWALSRFGKTLYKIFFQTYTQKVWGVPPRQLSADWAAQRIPVLKFHDILLELAGRTKRKHEAYARKFYYPKKGIGQIFDYMAEEVRNKRGTIHSNAKVNGILIENNLVKGITFLRNGQLHNIDCDYLISTIPLTELAAMTQGKTCSGPRASNDLFFRSVRFLNILIDKPKIGENTWVYVPENKYLMTRIQEPKLRSPFSAPKDKTSLILEIPCFYQDRVWNMDTKEVFERSIKDLSCLGIDIRGKVMDYFSTGIEYGYPVYALGYEKHTSNLLHYLANYKNLVTVGRQGLFRYVFMDQAMLMGLSAARHIAGDRSESRFVAHNIGMEKEFVESMAVIPSQ